MLKVAEKTVDTISRKGELSGSNVGGQRRYKRAELDQRIEQKKAFRKLGDMNGKEKVVDDLTKVVVDRVFLNIIHNLKEAAEHDDKVVLDTAKYIFKNNR